jgi:tRNA (guanine37-N1)-methyltransferase
MRLKEAFKDVLDNDEVTKLTESYDIIGDILIVKIHPDLASKKIIIGDILHKLYPRVRVIAAVPLYSLIDELYRTRDIEVIWGDTNLETTHRESGCSFMVNLEHVFFTPRLSYEHMRVAKKVAPGERIINTFAGVGCFSIIIAKMQPQTRIYSIDHNPYAVMCMKKNVAMNNVEGKVIPILGDAETELKKLAGAADRVLMPLPETAHSFLPIAIQALDLESAGLQGIIHYYAVTTGRRDGDLFSKPLGQVKDIVSSAFGNTLRIEVEEQRIVRSVGPLRYHVVLYFSVVK